MKIVYGLLVIALIGVFVVVREQKTNNVEVGTGNVYDTFAQCLTDAGAKFYGAYWCPHCQAQKKLFNNSKNLPYIECSTADGQGQTKVCADAGITGYPTWIFADGSQENGEQTFETLSEKTNCPLPNTP